jgi:hypothetical protein
MELFLLGKEKRKKSNSEVEHVLSMWKLRVPFLTLKKKKPIIMF